MPDYVPYEERARRRSDAAAAAEATATATRGRVEGNLRNLLQRIGTLEPDYHVEVLRPISRLRHSFTSKPVIQRGRDTFIIAEVVGAYHIQGAISTHRIKTEGVRRDIPNLDAYVTVDGRVWAKQNRAEGWRSAPARAPDELEGVLQRDDSSALHFRSLTLEELTRIHDGLAARQPADVDRR
jgi:hypothetical protein